MKKAMALLAKQRMKPVGEGAAISATTLGRKAESVAAVQMRNNHCCCTSLFHLITREETHLQVQTKKKKSRRKFSSFRT